MLLTQHFHLEEFTTSRAAETNNIVNEPNAEEIEALRDLAQALENVRDLLEFPIVITSGFRCKKLNSLLKGASNSHHILGFAADFICPDFGTPRQICQEIAASNLLWDQLILEGGAWVHYSIHPLMRQQILTASFANGKAHYVKGLA